MTALAGEEVQGKVSAVARRARQFKRFEPEDAEGENRADLGDPLGSGHPVRVEGVVQGRACPAGADVSSPDLMADRAAEERLGSRDALSRVKKQFLFCAAGRLSPWPGRCDAKRQRAKPMRGKAGDERMRTRTTSGRFGRAPAGHVERVAGGDWSAWRASDGNRVAVPTGHANHRTGTGRRRAGALRIRRNATTACTTRWTGADNARKNT